MLSLQEAIVIRDDPEAREKYNELGARKIELSRELGVAKGEIETILTDLGSLVASGKGFERQTDRLSKLRQQVEAISLGVQYVGGQRDLLGRYNQDLRSG